MSNINIGSISGSGHIFGNEGPVIQKITRGRPEGAVGPEQAGSTPSAPGYSSSHPEQDAENTRKLSDDEVVELARVYSSRDRATMLLQRAGFRMESLPPFDPTPNPYAYWREIGEQIGHGIVVGGRQRLLAVAQNDYPANPIFSGRHQSRREAG